MPDASSVLVSVERVVNVPPAKVETMPFGSTQLHSTPCGCWTTGNWRGARSVWQEARPAAAAASARRVNGFMDVSHSLGKAEFQYRQTMP